jgi:hypothetical protein
MKTRWHDYCKMQMPCHPGVPFRTSYNGHLRKTLQVNFKRVLCISSIGGFMLTGNEQRLVAYIERTFLQKRVKRTTEVGLISDETGLSQAEVTAMIPDLVQRGFLRTATESWKDYCWITIPSAALPPHLTICQPFGL